VKARVRFSKLGKLRFLSHRDLARLWERSLRRAGVAVAYSEGFSPRPRLHFGLALSTGHESLGEYLDVDLAPDAGIDVGDLPALVNAVLPDGIAAQVAIPVEPGTPSLQQAVTSCSWQLEIVGATPEEAAAAVARVLDARPAIVAVESAGPVGPPPGVTIIHPSTVLVAELATQPRSLRPAELVRALDADWHEGRVLRTHQWTSIDGARREPIPLSEGGAPGARSITHAGARAS
jgi:radical SAM-linked protein